VSDAAAFTSLAPNAGTFISAFAPWIALIGGVFLAAWVVSLIVGLGHREDSSAAQVAGGHSSAGKPGKMHDAVLSKASQRALRGKFAPQMIGGAASAAMVNHDGESVGKARVRGGGVPDDSYASVRGHLERNPAQWGQDYRDSVDRRMGRYVG
jgi:hypothetical protein